MVEDNSGVGRVTQTVAINEQETKIQFGVTPSPMLTVPFFENFPDSHTIYIVVGQPDWNKQMDEDIDAMIRRDLWRGHVLLGIANAIIFVAIYLSVTCWLYKKLALPLQRLEKEIQNPHKFKKTHEEKTIAAPTIDNLNLTMPKGTKVAKY